MNRRELLTGIAGVPVGLGALSLLPSLTVAGQDEAKSKKMFSSNAANPEEQWRTILGLSKEQLLQFSKLARAEGYKLTYDFVQAIGDTIKEKYETLYVLTVGASNLVYRRCGTMPANVIIACPEVCSMYETATAGFYPCSNEQWQACPPHIKYCGTVNSRWMVYKTPVLGPEDIVIACVDKDGLADAYHSAHIEFKNFII